MRKIEQKEFCERYDARRTFYKLSGEGATGIF